MAPGCGAAERGGGGGLAVGHGFLIKYSAVLNKRNFLLNFLWLLLLSEKITVQICSS